MERGTERKEEQDNRKLIRAGDIMEHVCISVVRR